MSLTAHMERCEELANVLHALIHNTLIAVADEDIQMVLDNRGATLALGVSYAEVRQAIVEEAERASNAAERTANQVSRLAPMICFLGDGRKAA